MRFLRPIAVALLVAPSACHGLPDAPADPSSSDPSAAGGPPATNDPSSGDPTVPAVDPKPEPPKVTETADAVTITNGLLTVTYDKHTGYSDYAFGAAPPIEGAYASVDLGAGHGGYVTSPGYPTHVLAGTTNVKDAEGTGIRVVLESRAPDKPNIDQIVTVYDGVPYFFVEENVVATSPIASNYLGALIVDDKGTVTPGPGADPRVLDVPFDNDEWVRYDARRLGDADFSGTGYEVTAVYETESRHGLVVGSVTHDFWKTGIYYEGTKGRLRRMNVWGGVSTPDTSSNAGPTYGKDGTHDVAKHGAMTGTTLASPRIFVGLFKDWRDGMEAFGKANARIAPPRAWSGGAPFGWMSWGAFGSNVTADKLTQVSDTIKAQLGTGFASAGPVYVNIDAGLKTDPTPIVQHIHANGQKAGTYRVPFSYFHASTDPNPLGRAVGAGTTYTYGDIVLRDDANAPIAHHGGYVLDPTHPGTRALMKSGIDSAVAAGFDYLKLDFMTDGTFEGKHFDPTVKTGVQAYNQAMTYLWTLIPSNVFVSLSIAPLFPSQYGHARRVSCDVIGQLVDTQAPAYPHYGSTEYLLNSLTYGWWMSGTIYPFNDPDAMALYQFQSGSPIPAEWSRTHVTASAIAGTVFLDSTDYTNPTAAARAVPLLTNAAVDDVARKGTFRPLDGSTGYVRATASATSVNAGSEAIDVFVRNDPAALYVAVFNYDPTNAATKSIDIGHAGGDPTKTYTVMDVWAGTTSFAAGSFDVPLAAGEAKLLKLTP